MSLHSCPRRFHDILPSAELPLAPLSTLRMMMQAGSHMSHTMTKIVLSLLEPQNGVGTHVGPTTKLTVSLMSLLVLCRHAWQHSSACIGHNEQVMRWHCQPVQHCSACSPCITMFAGSGGLYPRMYCRVSNSWQAGAAHASLWLPPALSAAMRSPLTGGCFGRSQMRWLLLQALSHVPTLLGTLSDLVSNFVTKFCEADLVRSRPQLLSCIRQNGVSFNSGPHDKSLSSEIGACRCWQTSTAMLCTSLSGTAAFSEEIRSSWRKPLAPSSRLR